ncbi:MAG: pyruvate ferredoxin oxidoreductase, partial [Deltaproteobacteria bacterium]|nr:pyruvate ferredoxin oxidoreductase [Deltaproteobacteria bacterium]
LPVSVDHIKAAIAANTKKAFAEINAKAFDLGFKAAA